MRKARFIEHQIFAVLKSVKDVCREVGISEACDIKNMKDLENVNRRLKPMFVDLSLECRHWKTLFEINVKTSDKASGSQLSDRAVCYEMTSCLQDIFAEQDGISISAGYATWWAGHYGTDRDGWTLSAIRL